MNAALLLVTAVAVTGLATGCLRKNADSSTEKGAMTFDAKTNTVTLRVSFHENEGIMNRFLISRVTLADNPKGSTGLVNFEIYDTVKYPPNPDCHPDRPCIVDTDPNSKGGSGIASNDPNGKGGGAPTDPQNKGGASFLAAGTRSFEIKYIPLTRELKALLDSTSQSRGTALNAPGEGTDLHDRFMNLNTFVTEAPDPTVEAKQGLTLDSSKSTYPVRSRGTLTDPERK
ncbi:MAG: hypothetical protein NTV34_16195 [Proteobacteria bacterium]|nr:hypothetical protein [Pseudomonadota bacterium]